MDTAFFNAVRSSLFGGTLSQGQVDGINAIALAWDKWGDGSLQRFAYVLATPFVETGGRYQAIYEGGRKSYFDKYEPGTKLGKRLGNTKKGDGYLYRGRGLVQITGRANYTRVGRELGIDLVNDPDLALDLAVAARILVVGTLKGWFTGKGLPDYIDDVDDDDDKDLAEYKQARRTVNGQDKADLIAGHALAFERALKSSGWKTAAKPSPNTAKPSGAGGPIAAVGAILVVIVGAILKHFGVFP